MDYFIKEKLRIYGVIRYQDDFLLFHQSKQYLKYCLNELTKFLKNEKLKLNSKTRIYKCTDNFIFIGRNKFGNYAKYRTVKRRLKKRECLYSKGYITISSLISSRLCYKTLCNNKLKF